MILSLDHPDFTNAAARLKQVLQDIVSDVQIQSDLTITHPEHQSIELPDQLQGRFEQLPSHVQHNYLRVKLQQFLQYVYYVSESREELEANVKIIENQAIEWSKSQFFQQLNENNHGDGYFESGWQIIGETKTGFLQVRKNDLTLHILRDRHLLDQEQSAKVGEVVGVKMPCRLVEPGYYIAVGTAGSINNLVVRPPNSIVDVYLNISSQGALALMHDFTTRLNAIKIPFHFKVLYQSEDYIYADTAIISFVKQDYDCLQDIIKILYRDNQAYFQPEIPLFTKYLASGLSIAERPPGDYSLAQHRFEIIAEALITAWQQNKVSIAERLECISDRFKQKNISLEYPYLNPNSKDIYFWC